MLLLREHAFMRLNPDLVPDTTVSREQRMSITFKDDCIYEHATARIHFTTYDLRRDQDIINPGTDKNIIAVHSPDEPGNHPWRYACVLGIFHASVRVGNGPETTLAFLWTRFFEVHRPGSASLKRLERLRYVRVATGGPPAFGFVDPAEVIRGVHLISSFEDGFTYNYMSRKPSMAYDTKLNGDWRYYDVDQ
jgi:hypothetical protein